MNTVKAPAMRYHGGKFRLAKWVMQFFPPHRIYVEPFGGAAGVLIQKPPAYSEVYNDLDGDLVNFFRCVQQPETRSRLTESVALTPYARREFEIAWTPSEDPIERARRLVIRAQMGFGSAGATKGTTGFRVDSKREYETAQHVWAKYPDTIGALGKRLTGVLIENRPALKVIADHDSEDTLFYVDPPYVHETRCRISGKGSSRGYRHELDLQEHAELLKVLLSVKGMVVLSGYRHDLYDQLLCGWDSYETDARISGGRGSAIRREVVWINPRTRAELNGLPGLLAAAY